MGAAPEGPVGTGKDNVRDITEFCHLQSTNITFMLLLLFLHCDEVPLKRQDDAEGYGLLRCCQPKVNCRQCDMSRLVSKEKDSLSTTIMTKTSGSKKVHGSFNNKLSIVLYAVDDKGTQLTSQLQSIHPIEKGKDREAEQPIEKYARGLIKEDIKQFKEFFPY